MRLTLFITFFCYSCLNFGQDSLQIDTTLKTSSYTNVDSTVEDSRSSVLKEFTVKTKKKRKKVQKPRIIDESNASNTQNVDGTNLSRNYNGFITLGILFISIILGLAISRLFFPATKVHDNTTSKNENFISDYFARMLLPRRDYYRDVYLNSEAWKRKRYVVLKRDNWRCVYCGSQATEVHHTRYAKRNIGKEPIEWLVSICRTCHDSKH